MDKLKCLLHIATLSYKTNATYKQSNLFGIIVNSFWLIIQMYILVAFIKHGISSYTVQQGVGYVVLTEALLTITGLSGSLGGIDIDDLIKSGNIIFYLTNPIGLIGYLIGMEVGRVLYYLLWRFLPLLLIGVVALTWYPNVTPMMLLYFVYSIIIGLVIANEIQFIIVMLAIKNRTSMGVVDLIMAIELFFSGGLLPLNIFPEWLYRISLYLPFSSQIIQMYILVAFIKHGISSYTVQQGVGYVVLTEALLTITGLSGSLGGIDIDDLIKSGNIIFYLTNPIGLIGYLIGMEVGRVLYYLLWRFLPLLLIGVVALTWYPNVTPMMLLYFVYSIIIGLVIANEIQFIIVMLAIKNRTSMGVVDLIMAIELFFSGGLLPLNIFPEWLYRISLYLPFSSQIYLPISIILGTEGSILKLLILETFWALALWLISYFVYDKERKKIYVQGG